MKRKKKWLAVIPVLLIGALALGLGKHFAPASQKSVYVYSFSDGIVGMSDYAPGASDSTGMISTDRIQPVYLTDTQTVLEIRVQEGQRVKKGDVLFTYDTTLSDLNLQQKELSVQQQKLDLKTARRELEVINSYIPISYHPVEPPEPTEPEQPEEPVKNLADFDLKDKAYLAYSGSGKTPMTPKFCWLRSDAMIDDAVMADLFKDSEEDVLFIRFQHTQDDKNDTPVIAQYGVKLMRLEQTDQPQPPTEPEQPTQPPTEPSDPTAPSHPIEHPAAEETEPDQPTEPVLPSEPVLPTEPPQPELPSEPQDGKTYRYRYAFYDPDAVTELPEEPPIFDDGIDMNSGFTAQEIADMRREKEEQIKDLEFGIKVSEAEYAIMQKEADSGAVVAQFDGLVQNVLDPDAAREEKRPLLKVSGGGGFYVTGTVSELDLGLVQVGQPITVTAWDTMQSYEGTVVEVRDYPVENQDYTFGAPSNVSYYPYRIFIDGSADLQDGFYVSMSLQTQAAEPSLYIDNAFLRTDGASSYVYVRDEAGLLKKQSIQVGASLWGSYTEVCSGITAEDWLAFPYGKTVKEGAPTQEGSWETLNGGMS